MRPTLHIERKARDAVTKKMKVSIRQATKREGEEQSVSAHLVIRDARKVNGRYRAALEEIPGIPMAAINQIISLALREYRYGFRDKRKNEAETYTTFKAEGLKSGNLTDALKTGHASFVTLSRPADAPFVDAGDVFRPTSETMRLKVLGEFDDSNWKKLLDAFRIKAKKNGWEDVYVDIEMDDKRRKTVKIERDNEAKEIVFVRSEQVKFRTALKSCADEIHDDTVEKADRRNQILVLGPHGKNPLSTPATLTSATRTVTGCFVATFSPCS